MIRTRFILIIGIIGVLCYNVTSLSAAVYRWKNGDGQTHYSSAPPSMPVENLEVKRGNRWYPYSAVEETPVSPPKTNASKAVVSYNKQNSMIILPVTVNQEIEKLFAVDTGASYTVISPDLVNALNLTPNANVAPIVLQTANGRIQAQLINLDTITIGQLTTHNVMAAVHDIGDDSNIVGLLGLNFLNRFKVTVDSTNHQFILEPLSSLAEYVARDCVAAREWLVRGQDLNNGSEEEASYYRQAISLCPNFVEPYYHLGTVYYQQKKYREAIDIHHQVLSMQPDEPEVHYRLGVLYLLEREFVLAKGEFETTLRLNPNHQQAKEYLEQLKNY